MLQTIYHSLTKQKVPEESRVQEIAIDRIYPNPNQPRREFQTEYLSELADSIRTYGVLQPISVRRMGDYYELIAGERRLRAAHKAGLTTIPALVMDASDEDSSVLALIENIMRRDLNFFEEAEGIKKLIDLYGFTQEEVAKKLCKTQSTVANKLRILKLPDSVRNLIQKYGLTERHARALLKLTSDVDREKVVKYVIKNNCNVKQTEELIDRLLENREKRESKKMFVFKDMRIFVNTINHALKVMQQSGVDAKAKKKETDDYIEYVILIPKEARQPEENKTV
ncbi:MAG: ParB/RepB/Spo0J family partition protein [Eubacteriales bacterium]